MGKIVVAGSLNMDLSVRSEHIPAAGETILGGDLLQSPGGKGANQAYAAAKLGGSVLMLGCVGQDDFGREMQGNLAESGCDVTAVQRLPGPSGVALILVSAKGENAIVVAPGANGLFTPEWAEAAVHHLEGAESLLVQLEIPLETVEWLARAAKARKVRVVLDPAPVPSGGVPDSLLALTDILTPNETEALALAGMAEQRMSGELAAKLAQSLAARGPSAVVLKLGERGCLLFENGHPTFLPAAKVKAVDTTAAGDIFNGALAVAMSESLPLRDACWFAARAAALSVTRKGAQLSTPARAEVDAFNPGA
jgi:ribokinase